MPNELIHRIVDFLKSWPPFSYIHIDDLYTISEQIQVKFIPKDTSIFHIGDSPHSHFYVVYNGHIDLLNENNHIVNTCDDGDSFGIRPLKAKSSYLLKAHALEDSLIYCIPYDLFDNISQDNPKVLSYLATLFATNLSKIHIDLPNKDLIKNIDTRSILQDHIPEVQSFTITNKAITAGPNESIKSIAINMSKQNIGSIVIVDHDHLPIGIVTDKDFRKHAVTGLVSIEHPISSIMSSPVHCIKEGLAIPEIQIQLLKNKINHLVVTEDGTNQSRVVSIISHHDVMIKLASSPIRQYKAIQKAGNIGELIPMSRQIDELLKNYLNREVSIPFTTEMVNTLNESLAVKCIMLAADDLGISESLLGRLCWLQLGSAGRKEQLLKTDQDNAIVFENGLHQADIDKIRALAALTNDYLDKIGFEYCPAEVMARNPNNCLSLDEFRYRFQTWIQIPDEQAVLNAGIFFDFHPIFGNTELTNRLSDAINEALTHDKLLLRMMVKENLNSPPPVSFFKNFVVERNGEHKELFDLKARAMAPLVDLARILVLEYDIKFSTNTINRFLKLAELEPQNSAIYHLAADAYEILLKFRAVSGITRQDSGRYINIKDLPKMDRLILRNCFGPIYELQKMLSIRYQLSIGF